MKLFISPNLPVDDTNTVQVGLNPLSDAELNQQESAPNAPPEYGRHQLDALYNDINASGYMSRAPSGSSTPFYAQSRSGSAENLQSLNGVLDTPAQGHFAPNLLSSRLANLQDQGSSRYHRMPMSRHSPSGGNTPHNGIDIPHRAAPHQQQSHSSGSYFSVLPPSGHSSPPHQSPSHSIPESRRTSDEHNMPEDHDLHAADYDMGYLSRVPSYGAAVRTPGPITPFMDGPPSYLEATSRPPSPVGIQRPSAAFVRSGVSTPSSYTSQHTLRDGSPIGPLIGADHVHLPTRNEDPRLRLLRARVE